MSMSAPVRTFSKIGPLETVRGGIGFTLLRSSFHLATSSIGLASAAMPTVRPERTGLVIKFDATRKFGPWSGIWSKTTNGDGSLNAKISVSAPISRFQWAP